MRTWPARDCSGKLCFQEAIAVCTRPEETPATLGIAVREPMITTRWISFARHDGLMVFVLPFRHAHVLRRLVMVLFDVCLEFVGIRRPV